MLSSFLNDNFQGIRRPSLVGKSMHWFIDNLKKVNILDLNLKQKCRNFYFEYLGYLNIWSKMPFSPLNNQFKGVRQPVG